MEIENYNFHPATTHWFTSQFSAPSSPQTQGWPVIAAGKHTLILAPTGSGKTLAAFLWCIDELFCRGLETVAETPASAPSGVHTLYISPLKALNNDIHCNLQEPLKGIRREARKMGLTPPEIRALVRTGDTPTHVRQSIVKRPPHILITTPESLYLLLTSQKGREIFRSLRYLIVDEIHALSSNKRGVHLSLSLERLMPLCQTEPVRIGLSATQRPLERIAAFLGGQILSEDKNEPKPRPVTIVDCGLRKKLDVKVISPVKSFSNLPEATVWPAVIDKLYELIRGHRTTLVFVNMRAQTERVARLLNDLHRKNTEESDVELALAHHGSISREARYDIEARLKAGNIPAVIATASLELGIDIGSIDLVVQLEAPRSVAGALQRVGRSGHLLSATSKGRIIPMYPSDLDDTVALSQCVQNGEIEETVIPENCLDVLAQQIVAEVAMQSWPRASLHRLIRQSYCYRGLSATVFNNVLDMLTGRFSGTNLRALQPCLSWDKVNDRLIARRRARLLAAMNGGTIPDRGYYSVYLADSRTKLGEMEEEFVFESRVGHIFFLGNNEWRIDSITRDHITVTPVRTVKPRAPFWKGDILYRNFSTSQKIGAFRRKLVDDGDLEKVEQLSDSNLPADSAIVDNLLKYLHRQRAHTEVLPTDEQIVGEWFRDSADEPHFILHTCFGARVNGAWAIALSAALEKRHQVQVQYSCDDDGIILRVLDTTAALPIDEMLKMSADEIENLLIGALADTHIFSVQFRYNAARALLFPRSQPNKRIPLWLQRLRASDLLQVVREFPDFPIMIETYRDCLQDVFDLPSLQTVIERIQRGQIRIHFVQTPFPSPMASGLMFNFMSNNFYEVDRSRYPAQAAAISSELLSEILSHETIPCIVTQEIVDSAEARWQHTAVEFQAASAEDLFAIIEKLAPITDAALQKRAKHNIDEWLLKLTAENRIVQIKGKEACWIPVSEAELFEETTSKEIMQTRLLRLLRVHGPVTLSQINQLLPLPENLTIEILKKAAAEKEVVHGKLVVGVKEEQWCDRHNFAELYRRAIAARRKATAPANRDLFMRFLLQWHKIGVPGQSFIDLIARYSAFRFPVFVFEREVLRSRFCAQNLDSLPDVMKEFTALMAGGEVIVGASRATEESRIRLYFYKRGTGHIMTDKDQQMEEAQNLESQAAQVYSFLKENGASFVRDIEAGTGLSSAQMQKTLSELAKSGLASCENYGEFLRTLQFDSTPSNQNESEEWLPHPLPAWTQRAKHRPQRAVIRKTIREQVQLNESRWFLTTSFAVMGKEISDHERTERQARMLLQRYGILVKEWYRREHGLLPWFQLFQVLKRLEWQGEVRRGYFIEGLSGIQFALPEAVAMLEKLQTEEQTQSSQIQLISTIDPALPFGGAVDWDLQDTDGNKVTVVRSPSNHLVLVNSRPVLYSENYGSRLWQLGNIEQASLDGIASAFKTWLQLPANLRPRRRIEILQINNQLASESRLVEVFLRNGFEQDGEKLVLWPSGV